MRNTLKHLTLLTRMKDDGLLPVLTGSFSEDAIEQACGQVETLQLQKRLHIRKTKRIQEELIRVPNFAALYGVLCRQEIGDEEIASVLESADGYGEKLTAYPQEQVLAVMKLELLPSLRFEYLKYYFPFVMYEEEEQVILDNLQTFPIAEWKGLSMLTEHQRDMMRQAVLCPLSVGMVICFSGIKMNGKLWNCWNRIVRSRESASCSIGMVCGCFCQ